LPIVTHSSISIGQERGDFCEGRRTAQGARQAADSAATATKRCGEVARHVSNIGCPGIEVNDGENQRCIRLGKCLLLRRPIRKNGHHLAASASMSPTMNVGWVSTHGAGLRSMQQTSVKRTNCRCSIEAQHFILACADKSTDSFH
jgi:hypothetical protein